MLRLCKPCGKELPATTEFFSVNRRRSDGLVLICKKCAAERFAAYYEKNRTKLVQRACESTRRIRQTPEGAERSRTLSREAKRRKLSDEVQRQIHRERAREWCAANPEKAKAFKHNHPFYRALRNASRQRRVRQATPSWVDKKAIGYIYAQAWIVTEITGIPHEVDHIHPIAGNNSCGLHVPWNLQVITAKENRIKSNKPQQ